MLKRSLFIGVLCLCLIALVGTDASARCRVIGGVLKCSDLCPFTSGTGAGNVDKNTVAICVSIAIDEAGSGEEGVPDVCWNPAWNSSTTASHVFLDPIVAGAVQVTNTNLTDERGSFEVDFADYNLCLSWPDDIWPALNADACPNGQWHYVRYEANPPSTIEAYCHQDPDGGWWCPARIITMYSYHVAYQEDKKSGDLVPVSGLCVKCIYDPDGDQCDEWGNPITCSPVDTNFCTDRDLDSVCDNAVQ